MSLGYRVGHGRTSGLAALVVPVLAMPFIVGALAVFVQTVPASSRDVGDDPRAVQLLRQSAEAGEHVSYSGTQYVSTWSALTQSGAATSAVVQVQHAAGGQTSISLHDRQTAILDGRTTSRWLAGDDPADLLLGAYTVRLVGVESVAGRPTDIVVAYRGDGSVAAKLWLDRETALPLRRESYTSDGYTLSASAFVTIVVGTAANCCKAGDGVGTAATYDDTASMLRWDDIEQLREDGWHCPGSLGEGLDLYEARRVGDAIQLSYSDGVMTVSVFEQAGWLDPNQLDGYGTADYEGGVVYTRPGPPARLTWSSGGRVITVVAEAPLDAVRDLLKNLPPDPVATDDEKKDGFLDRISRGAQRVGSWFNPFD